ncbi:MAG: GH92 family glycosyl hydrolase [Flavobacteriales bacterium]|nr:GH92 family glycosyl hydrolase [Flavobacteriales bacterium]
MLSGFRCKYFLALFLAGVLPPYHLRGQQDIARDLVNPFVGTGGHGHTFPGACVPFGLVQVSPDTRPDGYNDWDGCGGYHHSDSVIYGFSHTHLSGTGVADLCDVLLMPMSGHYSFDPKEYRSGFSHNNERANAGYYQVLLDGSQVNVEVTATPHVGMHRYQFPKDSAGFVVLDLRHRDEILSSDIVVIADDQVVGSRISRSWARAQNLNFYIEFSRPFKSSKVPQETVQRGDVVGPGMKDRAVFEFAPSAEPLVVKVSISAVTGDGAMKNETTELPGWDFDAVRKQAEVAWNEKLGKVKVSGGSLEQQRIFYTALYHSMIAPYVFNDVDGQYRGMDGQVHQADHNVYTVFSLWDTFRATHPLLTILEPDRVNDFIKTFLLHYQQGGRLPVWELWGNETDCMIGYHSASVIGDAYLKGIRGFNADLALEAMVNSAMRDEPGLNAYRSRGYISSEDQAESVSRTLEYAYDDWCIAQMAEALGRDSLAEVFNARAHNWQNLLDPETRFFRPRRNGGFIEPFDPYEVNFHFTEANAWQYSFFVPHHLDRYMAVTGGDGAFASPAERALFSGHTYDRTRASGYHGADRTVRAWERAQPPHGLSLCPQRCTRTHGPAHRPDPRRALPRCTERTERQRGLRSDEQLVRAQCARLLPHRTGLPTIHPGGAFVR